MLEKQTPIPGSDKMLKQVTLEPSDLAKYDKLLTEHRHWLSVARDFFPESNHLNEISGKLAKMHQDIKGLINYGVPSETE